MMMYLVYISHLGLGISCYSPEKGSNRLPKSYVYY